MVLSKEQIKEKIIAAGVKNLNEFGFPGCTKENICTDAMYKEFFKSMLQDNIGNGQEMDEAIADIEKTLA